MTPDDERIDFDVPVVAKPPKVPKVNPLLGNLFVEVHTYDNGRRDLTPWCQTATVSLSLSEPWTTIEFTLNLPWASRNQAPRAGDWIVVRDLSGGAKAWGMVDSAPSPGVEGGPSGIRASRPIQVRAVSWLALLRRALVFASPYALAGRSQSVGSFFDGEDWNSRIMTLAQTVINGDLGVTLAQTLKAVARLRLPPTLGGDTLANTVQVVRDTETARAAGLDRLLSAPVKGPRVLDTSSLYPSSSNLLDFILGIFVPDRQLIEFWETLAPLSLSESGDAQGLGAVPTLVYRLRPWQTEPLSIWLARDSNTVGSGDSAGPVIASAVAAPDQALTAAFGQVTWNPGLGSVLVVNDDGIDFPTPSRNDSERVNMVTVGLPTQSDSPVRFWNEAGLPFMDATSVERFGARLFQPNWPYFPASPTDPAANSPLGTPDPNGPQGNRESVDGETLVGYLRTIAGLAAMMFIGRERFFRGSFTTGTLRQDVAIGTPTTLIWPTGTTFTAYTESVTMNVAFNGPAGACNGYLSVGYSRGLYNGPGERESTERQAISVPTPRPSTKASPQASSAPVVCRRGKRADAWPSSLVPIVPNDYTRSLKAWALSRGFSQSAFGAESSDQWKRVMVSAACARVIEYYWRQQTSGATVRVLSNVRAADAINDPNANHSSGASIDFAVMAPNPLGALQTWGALFRLSGAGRIPLGGRGLYLNVSSGGITGTTPTEAGSSSSRITPGPGGSSAGVHYDYRNTFGFRPGAPANKWLGLDTTGNGTDDYMIGGVRSEETLPYLSLHLPTVAAYYRNQGVNDPALIEVTDTVPNALQMLGLEAWCSP